MTQTTNRSLAALSAALLTILMLAQTVLVPIASAPAEAGAPYGADLA